MHSNTQVIVRTAQGSGRWFPADPDQLRSLLNDCIEGASVSQVKGRIIGAIAPHAGYVYSGRVAGYVYRALRDQASQGLAPETVVVLGLSHRSGFPGVALMDGGALLTPLGAAPLDQAATALLLQASPRLRLNYAAHRGEHSAENQVPFIQTVLPKAGLVLGLIGDHDPQTRRDLLAALTALAEKKPIVVIASSDMLHDPDYAKVTKTDQATLQQVAALQTAELCRAWSPQRQTFCALAAVAATLDFVSAQGCREGRILYYRNSGDDFPESRGNWVVGYGAVIFSLAE